MSERPTRAELEAAGYSVRSYPILGRETFELTKPDGNHAFSSSEGPLWAVARSHYRAVELRRVCGA